MTILLDYDYIYTHMQFYKKDKPQEKETIQGIGNDLQIFTFSADDGATKNMTAYKCGDDIIVVDVGVEFPDDSLPGIDVVIPDFTYLIENQEKIRGVFISHAHEDHLGAIPYLLQQINVPIYANPLVQGFVKERIRDRGGDKLLEATRFHLIGPDVPEIVLGNFRVSTFRVNHSVPTTLGISIMTPQGRVLHMADYKIDWTPVIDEPIDIATISRYGEEGVLCLLSDCLGADHEGHSKSEQALKDVFHELFEKAGNKQIMVTSISSNISRMYQIIEAAVQAGRKVVLGGRSIRNAITIAQGQNMLPFDESVFLTEKQIGDYAESSLVYIVAGCFGQTGSSLDKISRGEHRFITLEEGAVVIFSAEPSPPGTRLPVERMMDRLTLAGAEVIYSKIQENLHISGHGPKEDLKTIAALVKPKYFIPIGGNATQARAYKNWVVGELGFDKNTVFELLEGESVIFSSNQAVKGERVPSKRVLVDGRGVGDVGEVVIKDREQLSTEGVFVVVVPISRETKKVMGSVEVITRGFVYVKESKQLIGQIKDMVNKTLDKEKPDNSNWGALQSRLEKDVGKSLYKETGRNPMVIVHSVTV